MKVINMVAGWATPVKNMSSSVGMITILENDGVRQWEGWHPIYEMENKQRSKPPTSYV